MHRESSNQCTRSELWITIIVKNIVDIIIFGIFLGPDRLSGIFILLAIAMALALFLSSIQIFIDFTKAKNAN